ncbi:unnamed protein product, partial [marine sediment metagenome]
GSVQIRIDELKIIDRVKRYQKIFLDGLEDGNRDAYVAAFKQWMEKWNDNKPFDDLPNIKDLKSIMNLKNPPDNTVQYPPGGYQWFMHHKNEPLLAISEIEARKKQGQ